MGRRKDIQSGDMLGGLKVIKEVDPYTQPNGQRRRRLLVSCRCGDAFEISLHNIRYNQNQSCGCVRTEEKYKLLRKEIANKLHKEGLLRKGNDVSDEFTPFRYVMKGLCGRKGKDVKVTLVDLKAQWEIQEGICIYSKVKLILPTHTTYNSIHHNYQASVDRIDSNNGYLSSNIQFISVTCNYAKGTMSHEEMMDFITLIKSPL